MFHSISVLFTSPAADGGAQAHAVEWAARFGLPVRRLEPADGRWAFQPLELCIFDRGLPADVRDALLSLLQRSPRAAALICPPAWRPVSRVLVLNPHARPGEAFLDATAAVCRAFGGAPVLLSVARSEREARARERSAEEAFAHRGLAVDCDLAAGGDPVAAAARAARWRRCSHVFVEHRCVPRWRRWLGGDVVRELAALPDSPALLAVHGAAPDVLPEAAGSAGRDRREAIRGQM